MIKSTSGKLGAPVEDAVGVPVVVGRGAWVRRPHEQGHVTQVEGLVGMRGVPVAEAMEPCLGPGPLRDVDISGPFRASEAIAAGRISRGRVAGPNTQRLFPDVHAAAIRSPARPTSPAARGKQRST